MNAAPRAPGAGARRFMRRARPDAPRQYHGGQTANPAACIDWLRMSGPRCAVSRACRLLERHLGESKPGGGRFFLPVGTRWGNAGVYWDPEDGGSGHCVVDLPAATIKELGHAALLSIAQTLYRHGFKGTRVDVAIDWRDGLGSAIIDLAADSCGRGELTGARRYQLIQQVASGQMTGHGLNIGGRGKMGSGRYLRIYDKGLEQQVSDPGDWVRWEVEFTGDCAAEALGKILESDDALATAVSLAFGVCDFRRVTGDQHVANRPRVRWFEQLLASVTPERVVASRTPTTPASYGRWVKNCVAPKLATMAAASGHSLAGLVSSLVGEVRPRIDHLSDAVVRAVLHDLGVSSLEARRNLEFPRVVCLS